MITGFTAYKIASQTIWLRTIMIDIGEAQERTAVIIVRLIQG